MAMTVALSQVDFAVRAEYVSRNNFSSLTTLVCVSVLGVTAPEAPGTPRIWPWNQHPLCTSFLLYGRKIKTKRTLKGRGNEGGSLPPA